MALVTSHHVISTRVFFTKYEETFLAWRDITDVRASTQKDTILEVSFHVPIKKSQFPCMQRKLRVAISMYDTIK